MAGKADDVSISISGEEEAFVLVKSQMRSPIPQPTEPDKATEPFSTKPPQIQLTNSLVQRKSSPTRSLSSKPLYNNNDNDNSTLPKVESLGSPPSLEKNKDNGKNPYRRINWKLLILFIESTVSVFAIGLLIASLTADKWQNRRIWDFEIWKWCVLLLSIFCGRLIAYTVREVLMALIWKLYLDERVLYFAHGVKKSVVFCIWLGLVTLSWRSMFHRGDAQRKTSRVLAGLLIGSGVWLVKTFLVKLIGSLHARKLFEKIKEAIRLRKVLKQISKMDDIADSVEKQNGKNIYIEDMIELLNAVRGKMLLPLTYYGSNIRSHEDEINDEAGARAAADEIFVRLAGNDADSKYIYLENLMKYLDDENVIQHFQGLAEDNVQIAAEPDNTDENKQIKRSVFRSWVVEVYKEHDSLNSTLKHSKTALDELNVIFSVIVLFIITVVWLLFMGFLTVKILVFLSSQLLLVVFMFGNTCKTIFEAIIFVFVVHPFDIGDRCVIDSVQMTVDEMNILTTTFLRHDGEKIYYPNAVLATKPISNLYRSPPMTDCLEFAISLRTKKDVINHMQEKIKSYVESNPRRWRPEHSVQFKEIENVNKMKMVLYVNHTINFHYFAKRAKRRSDLVLKMKDIFEELKVEYSLLPQYVNLLSYSAAAPSTAPLPVGRPCYF